MAARPPSGLPRSRCLSRAPRPRLRQAAPWSSGLTYWWPRRSIRPSTGRCSIARATRGIPVIAESAVVAGAYTLVAVDNFQAGMALGRWAGSHAAQREKPVRVLDLGYHLDNTRARSQGFIAGLRETLPAAEIVLSIGTQSTRQSAYQLTGDVLDVHGEINMIFAINDATAWGAWQACEERGIPPDAMTLLTFGLEGDTLRAALASGSYCSAGLAMFPEIVGPVCVEAAVAAFQGRSLPAQLVTPHAVLTPETLSQYYTITAAGWQLNWENGFRAASHPAEYRSPNCAHRRCSAPADRLCRPVQRARVVSQPGPLHASVRSAPGY